MSNNKSNGYLEAGKIVSTHSFRGEVKILCWCDTPEFLAKFKTLYLDDKGVNKLTVKEARIFKNMLIAAFAESTTEDDAIKLKNKTVYIKKDDAELEDGAFFVQDLLGLPVYDFENASIKYGELADIFNNGASDIYVIRTEAVAEKSGKNKEVLVPNVPAFVKKVSLHEGIFITPIEGMFSEQT